MNSKVPGRHHASGDENSRINPVMTDRRRTVVESAAYVDAVYRLRFVLGPTVAPQTLEWNRRKVEEERASLLAQGVSPELLALVD